MDSKEVTPYGSVAPVFIDTPARFDASKPLDPFEFAGQSPQEATQREAYQQEADPLFF